MNTSSGICTAINNKVIFLFSYCLNTSTDVVAGWNDITITSTTVVTGNYYWLSYITDSAISYYQAVAGTLRYKITPYSSFTFPNPAGTGFSSYATSVGLVAGWGY